MKSRLAFTVALVLASLLATTQVALATGNKHSSDEGKSAATVQYGHDEGAKRPGDKTEGGETLAPPGTSGSDKPGGGGPGAASAVTVGGATSTGTAPGAGAPGSLTSPGGPGAPIPGAGGPGVLTVPGSLGTVPGGPGAGGPGAPGAPTTGAPGGPSTDAPSAPGTEGPFAPAGSEGGVAGEVASGGPDTARQAPTGGDVRPGDQVSAGGKPGLAFTGFAAIPVLLSGLALLAGGLLLRRSRSTA